MTPIERWLQRATRSLASESAAQVRAEITDHYQSALEAALVPGTPHDEATSAALRSLGDPREANRLYRRSLLTSMEGHYLRYLRRYDAQPGIKYLVGFGWFVAMHLMIGVNAWTHGRRAATFAAFSIALIWGFCWHRVSLIVRMPERARHFRRQLGVAAVANLVLLPVLGAPWLAIGPLALGAFLNAQLHQSIRRKLSGKQYPVAVELF